jgi:hypothetical protein
MVSFVICSIDPAKFAAVKQNIALRMAAEPHEVIGVHDAKSLAEGYNRGAARARGETIVFCHDDIEILNPDFAQRLRQHLDRFDVLGVAGTDRLVTAKWTDSGPPHVYGQIANPNLPNLDFTVTFFSTPPRVVGHMQALDGVLLAVRRAVLETVRFDAETFDGWHMYDVDFTFRAYLAGLQLGVCGDLHVLHGSRGDFGENYQAAARRLEAKHAGKLVLGGPRAMVLAGVRAATKAEITEIMSPPPAERAEAASLITPAPAPATPARTDAAFDPLDHPIVFAPPRYLSGGSAWVEHIPLAFLLVDLLRPRVLVELGTHHGDSYCAFCQAVEQLGLGGNSTRCFAVDTWRGDAHAGFYGDDVIQRLRQRHDPAYGTFSTLVRSDFDSAVSHFADGSIDLLHVDGHHEYESVRHDFERWQPKLSERAVVLLHDTAERGHGFGVWRLWQELSPRWPSFEFTHGHGLGVLAVGPAAPGPVLALLRSCNARPAAWRGLFETLGQRVAGHSAAPLADCWNLLDEYRQITRQLGGLGRITLEQAAQHLSELGVRVVQELKNTLENELRRRQSTLQPPPPPAPT